MRAETKLGVIVPLVVLAVGAVWWFSRPSNELPDLSIDKPSMDAAAKDAELVGDAVPVVKEPPAAGRPAISPPNRKQATRRPNRRVTTAERPTQPAGRKTEKPLANQSPSEQPGADTTPVVDATKPSQPTDRVPPLVTPDVAKTDDTATREPAPAKSSEPAEPPPAVENKPERKPAATPVTERPRTRTTLNERRPSARKSYTIQPGDRLIDIAVMEFGDGALWKAIKAANPDIDENCLRIGDKIEIPSRQEASRLMRSEAPPATEAPGIRPPAGRAADTPRAGRATYVVEAGDSLIKIARNVLNDAKRWEEIYELNRDRLQSPHLLRIGMELRLPPVPSTSSGARTGED